MASWTRKPSRGFQRFAAPACPASWMSSCIRSSHQNNFVYLSYAKPLNEKESATAIARGKWNGTALTDVSDVFVAPAGVGGGARMAFGRDGTLYVTTGGGGGNGPQDPNSLGGKVLRLQG